MVVGSSLVLPSEIFWALTPCFHWLILLLSLPKSSHSITFIRSYLFDHLFRLILIQTLFQLFPFLFFLFFLSFILVFYGCVETTRLAIRILNSFCCIILFWISFHCSCSCGFSAESHAYSMIIVSYLLWIWPLNSSWLILSFLIDWVWLCFPICTSVIIAVISVVLHFCFGFWPYGNANLTINMKHFVSDRSVSEWLLFVVDTINSMCVPKPTYDLLRKLPCVLCDFLPKLRRYGLGITSKRFFMVKSEYLICYDKLVSNRLLQNPSLQLCEYANLANEEDIKRVVCLRECSICLLYTSDAADEL